MRIVSNCRLHFNVIRLEFMKDNMSGFRKEVGRETIKNSPVSKFEMIQAVLYIKL